MARDVGRCDNASSSVHGMLIRIAAKDVAFPEPPTRTGWTRRCRIRKLRNGLGDWSELSDGSSFGGQEWLEEVVSFDSAAWL